MEISMPKCKITILKRSLNSDLIEEYIEDIYRDMKPCEIFKNGQEIIIDPNLAKMKKSFKIQSIIILKNK